jgi:hypothetical protein
MQLYQDDTVRVSLGVIRIYKKINKIFNFIRRFKLRLALNNAKFNEQLLSILSKIINSQLNKEIEFNLINVKSLTYNSDIFTEIITKKLRNPRRSPMGIIKAILGRVTLPNINSVIEKSRFEKMVNSRLLDNRYKNMNIISNLDSNPFLYEKEDNLNGLLNKIYFNNKYDHVFNNIPYLKLRNTILSNIHYKNIGGITIKVKGRLTRRYRADRAVSKFN